MHGPAFAWTRRWTRNGRTRPRALKNRLPGDRSPWRGTWAGRCGLNRTGRSGIHGTRASLRHNHARRGPTGSLRTGGNGRLRPNHRWSWGWCGWRHSWRCGSRLRSRWIGRRRRRRLSRGHNHGARGLRWCADRGLRSRRLRGRGRRRFGSRWSGRRYCRRLGLDGRSNRWACNRRSHWRRGTRRRRRWSRRLGLRLLLPQ